MAYIEFKNIDKFYGDNHVLKGINLEINKGDFVTPPANGYDRATLPEVHLFV